jgi:hypothetical protein
LVCFEVVRHPGKRWNIVIDGVRPCNRRPLIQLWCLDLFYWTLTLEAEYIVPHRKKTRLERVTNSWLRLIAAAGVV